MEACFNRFCKEEERRRRGGRERENNKMAITIFCVLTLEAAFITFALSCLLEASLCLGLVRAQGKEIILGMNRNEQQRAGSLGAILEAAHSRTVTCFLI